METQKFMEGFIAGAFVTLILFLGGMLAGWQMCAANLTITP